MKSSLFFVYLLCTLLSIGTARSQNDAENPQSNIDSTSPYWKDSSRSRIHTTKPLFRLNSNGGDEVRGEGKPITIDISKIGKDVGEERNTSSNNVYVPGGFQETTRG